MAKVGRNEISKGKPEGLPFCHGAGDAMRGRHGALCREGEELDAWLAMLCGQLAMSGFLFYCHGISMAFCHLGEGA